MTWVILGVVLGAGLNIWADSLPPPYRQIAKVASIVLIAGPGIYNLITGVRRDRQIREAARRSQIEDKLSYAVESLFPGENARTIRANIILPYEDDLRIAHRWNMDGWPDRDLALPYGSGVAGSAWEHAHSTGNADRWRPLVAPRITQEDLQAWNVTRQVAEVTAHVRWIVSTPILSQYSREVLGIFNIDGVEELADLNLIQANLFYQRCSLLAELFASLLE